MALWEWRKGHANKFQSGSQSFKSSSQSCASGGVKRERDTTSAVQQRSGGSALRPAISNSASAEQPGTRINVWKFLGDSDQCATDTREKVAKQSAAACGSAKRPADPSSDCEKKRQKPDEADEKKLYGTIAYISFPKGLKARRNYYDEMEVIREVMENDFLEN